MTRETSLGLPNPIPARMVWIGVLVVVMLAAIGYACLASSFRFRCGSKRDCTNLWTKKYAYEAYPSWAAAHPDEACPERLDELSEYVHGIDTNDAWGRPLKMMCGASLPPGARGLAVMSRGEDGREGTEDDVKSWE